MSNILYILLLYYSNYKLINSLNRVKNIFLFYLLVIIILIKISL